MWRLTIKRKYKKTWMDGETFDMESEFVYESNNIENLVFIVESTKTTGVGTFEYNFVHVKEGEQE